MIEFSLELSALFVPQFRLQSDKKTWRHLTSNDWIETDFKTQDPYEIIRLQEVDSRITIDGNNYRLNVTEGSFENVENELHYDVYVHRNYFPITPSIEQLTSVLQQGDDRFANALILNVHGFFELRQRGTINLSISDPTIVARYETLGAGNGYVGADIVNYMDFVNSAYKALMSAWADHIVSGATDIDTDQYEPIDLDELLLRIEAARMEFERAAAEGDE